MNRRQFIKGVCGVFAAVVLPISKVAIKSAKQVYSYPLTLFEILKRRQDSSLLNIVEALSESNEILKDEVITEHNIHSHRRAARWVKTKEYTQKNQVWTIS